MIPDECVIRVDCRPQPGVTVGAGPRRRSTAASPRPSGPTRGSPRRSRWPTSRAATWPSPATEVVRLMADAVRLVRGEEPALVTENWLGDTASFGEKIPTVIFGPGGPPVYCADEHLSVEDIHEATKVYATFAALALGQACGRAHGAMNDGGFDTFSISAWASARVSRSCCSPTRDRRPGGHPAAGVGGGARRDPDGGQDARPPAARLRAAGSGRRDDARGCGRHRAHQPVHRVQPRAPQRHAAGRPAISPCPGSGAGYVPATAARSTSTSSGCATTPSGWDRRGARPVSSG